MCNTNAMLDYMSEEEKQKEFKHNEHDIELLLEFIGTDVMLIGNKVLRISDARRILIEPQVMQMKKCMDEIRRILSDTTVK